MEHKKTIDYSKTLYQMGDLLNEMEVSIKRDFTVQECQTLRKCLEAYMSGEMGNGQITLDLKKFFLTIQGADEASYLYQYVL